MNILRISILSLGLSMLLSGCSGNSNQNQSQNQKIQMGGSVQGNSLQLSQVVSTIAGTSPGSADGIGSAARFNSPSGITTDGAFLFVADRSNRTIRKIDIATQTVTTLAGSPGSNGFADGTGSSAIFSSPYSLTRAGTNLYVTDSSTIRKVVIATGEVTTIAGNASSQGSADGTGAESRFNNLTAITSDGTSLFVADNGNHTIRKLAIATSEVTTLAGTAGILGSADGIGVTAKFGFLGGITTDGINLFIADSSNRKIRKVVIATGEVSTLSVSSGINSTAGFSWPNGITTDGTNLFITDSSDRTVLKLVLSSGTLTTLAGSSGSSGSTDGIGAAAKFNNPIGIAFDGSNLFVTDSADETIRKIVVATGEVSTLAGTASPGSSDGTGTAARFYYPNAITTDGTNLYVADTFNFTIRKVAIATGAVTTLAGTAKSYGSVDGSGPAARFGYLKGITTDGTNVFVTDYENHTIRKIVIASGEVSTLAGSAGNSGSADGVGVTARFKRPYGITTDGTRLFVTDAGNHTIRKIVIATGEVTTLAGTAGTSGAADGTGNVARFKSPYGLTTDGINLFVADAGNEKVRKVVIVSGEVTTMVETSLTSSLTAGKSKFLAATPLSAEDAAAAQAAAQAAADAAAAQAAAQAAADAAAATKAAADAAAATKAAADAAAAQASAIPVSSVPVPASSMIAVTATTPIGISTDGANLYITNPYMIRKMEIATGIVTVIAGSGSYGSKDGKGTETSFSGLSGITIDGKSLYVTDSNNSIRKIN